MQRAMMRLGVRFVPDDKLDAFLDEVSKLGKKYFASNPRRRMRRSFIVTMAKNDRIEEEFPPKLPEWFREI
jgi:hypothetical protein